MASRPKAAWLSGRICSRLPSAGHSESRLTCRRRGRAFFSPLGPRLSRGPSVRPRRLWTGRSSGLRPSGPGLSFSPAGPAPAVPPLPPLRPARRRGAGLAWDWAACLLRRALFFSRAFRKNSRRATRSDGGPPARRSRGFAGGTTERTLGSTKSGEG